MVSMGHQPPAGRRFGANDFRQRAVIIGDYGKGVVTHPLLETSKHNAVNAACGSAWIPNRPP
jgi:hypothetical protein